MYFVQYKQPYIRFDEPSFTEAQKIAFGLKISETWQGAFSPGLSQGELATEGVA